MSKQKVWRDSFYEQSVIKLLDGETRTFVIDIEKTPAWSEVQKKYVICCKDEKGQPINLALPAKAVKVLADLIQDTVKVSIGRKGSALDTVYTIKPVK